MYIVPNRIFSIPEIEDLIFDYLDPIKDLKNVSQLNHYYAYTINKKHIYVELKNFCLNKGEHYKNLKWKPSEFIRACIYGQLEVVKYIYGNKKMDIHADNEGAFRSTCSNGHLEVAIWLYSLQHIDIHANNEDAFRWACHNGHLEVALWLYSLRHIDIHVNNEGDFEGPVTIIV